ncbi:MAG: hypothetical protein R3C20_05805 [Planctomycetaceae bacterium]
MTQQSWIGKLALDGAIGSEDRPSLGAKRASRESQQDAYAQNRNLFRPAVRPPYSPLPIPGEQAIAIVRQLKAYHIRRGFLKTFDDTVAYLHHAASSNQFEKALADLGSMIGFSTERHDVNGEGPDVLWLLPGNVGLVIEAKSRKKAKNADKGRTRSTPCRCRVVYEELFFIPV